MTSPSDKIIAEREQFIFQREPSIKSATDRAQQTFPQVFAIHPLPFLESKSHIEGREVMVVSDLSDEFFALCLGSLGNNVNPVVFVAEEDKFYRYNNQGIYKPVSEGTLTAHLAFLLDECLCSVGDRIFAPSLFQLKNKERLNRILDRAKDLLAADPEFFLDPGNRYLPLKNGIYDGNTKTLLPHSPSLPFKYTLPVEFDPEAKCDLFLNLFLRRVLSEEDVELLQMYFSQMLTGRNYSQRILVLTGKSGWGKGMVMGVLQGLFGEQCFGILRKELLFDRYELARHESRTMLYHPDMPTDYLTSSKASLFKQLVGGDLIWADRRNQDEPVSFNGDFLCVLSCNGKPQIYLDEDMDAWSRRLSVVEFKQPPHGIRIGKAAELLQREAPGILNWLIEGRAKLVKKGMQIQLSEDQQQRVTSLLFASDSARVFVRVSLIATKGRTIFTRDLYGSYRQFCRVRGVKAIGSRKFVPIAAEAIRDLHGLGMRHDLLSEGGSSSRGWKGLMLQEINPE